MLDNVGARFNIGEGSDETAWDDVTVGLHDPLGSFVASPLAGPRDRPKTLRGMQKAAFPLQQ